MFRNNLKIAIRNIFKNKGLYSINIVGLSIGIASCLLITLFVFDELSYDQFNEKADQIVRVVFKVNIGNEHVNEGVVMAPVAQTFKNDFPEVIDATRIMYNGPGSSKVKNIRYRNVRFAYVDPNFFEIFTLPIIKGDKVDPLKEAYTAVLTKSEAKKYFGNKGAIGQHITLPDNNQYRVTAIIDEVPHNSHFHFEVFASTVGLTKAKEPSWFSSNFYTYLLLKEGVNLQQLESKFQPLIKKYIGPEMQNELGMTFSEFSKNNTLKFLLQPLTAIHLNSDFLISTEIEQTGNIKYVYIFSFVGFFMLLIACINFINLSTAAASKRAKEVGVRKILGSNKNQLIYQFLSESFIATLAAMVLALALFVLALPLFQNISNKTLNINTITNPITILFLFLLIILISLLAGGYPAFFLSSFKPISALKNKVFGNGQTKNIRSGLVVFQFAISACLILATLIAYQQMNFIQNKNLGYDRDKLLIIRDAYLLGENINAFKNQIKKDPTVLNISQSSYIPAGESRNYMSMVYMEDKLQRRIPLYVIDDNYIPTMGIDLVIGRNFSKEFSTDTASTIINEKAAEILGFSQNHVLGKSITTDNISDGTSFKVIGVVKNFHFKSLHQPIEPLIMINGNKGGLIIKTKGKNITSLIESMSREWKKLYSKEPFSFTLLNDDYNATYRTEQKMGAILTIFAVLTIFVACLGLFGLVTYTTEQRFKEIGIRKVLGSSVPQIVALLSKDFLKPVILSLAIAFPLGYFFMQRWLQDFAYRINIKPFVFVVAGIITVLIAVVTISFKSIKAAMANPVKSLKTE